MNKLIINFIMLFKPLFTKMGVDTQQLRVILEVKLLMDDRRPYNQMRRAHKQKKDTKNTSLLAMFFLALMGCFMIFLLTMGNPLLGHTLYLSMFMIMMALTLVSDFTSVLIDVRDNFIILPRPVNDSTFTTSRILHITVHVFKMLISIGLPGLIYVVITDGPLGGIAFFVEIIATTLFSIFVVNMIYLLVLKVSSPEKFKNFISYFQIFVSIFVFAGYQVLPRISTRMDLHGINLLAYKLAYVYPPVWFASFYDTISHPETFAVAKLVMGVIGIIVPFVTIFIVVRYLAPGFNRKLSAIAGSGSEPEPQLVTTTGAAAVKEPATFVSNLSKFLCKDPVEQAGFKLTWWLTSRYRDFKVKVYPSFAYVPVYFVYYVFLGKGSGRNDPRSPEITEGQGYLLLTYLTSFVILTVLSQISQSEKYKAAWVMFSTPHNRPGKIVSGMFKAVMLKYFVPFYLVVSIFGLFLWGPVIINDLVLSFFNILVYGVILAIINVTYLPFSQPAVTEGGKTFARFLVMFVIFILGMAHYALSRWEWAINTGAVFSILLFWVLFHYFSKRDWKAMEADYG
ncbi:hypothetical protein [Hufsiella ginkgonis]|uniref:Uncharacterized protein n=1 Tax=Hufsiella ginkgonis TaxID=2695274 RepID=A0A7K1XVD7_9SPHI|nr:hypothetical protein [Hufsiella ginkgonis]MXV14729.1 hypothetical protein [Hufsiella ginkgonis]